MKTAAVAAAPGLTWEDYLVMLVSEHGSLAAIALKVSLAGGNVADAASVERALRRLRKKEHHEGGQYGQRLLRVFGVPREVEQRVKWMGVYHSRFTDLPVSLCLDQLRVWDRPPVSASRARAWLELGFATCALRLEDLSRAEAHLKAARGGHVSVEARIETLLIQAYVASRRGERALAREGLAEVEPMLEAPEIGTGDRACLLARWLDQRAYQLLHPAEGSPPDLEGAMALYQRIPTRAAPFFAACKRDSGLAYVHFCLGDAPRAVMHAEAACQSAGDGGFVRLRIACLGLLARVLGDSEARAAEIRARAILAARALEDEDLLGRLRRAAPPIAAV